jgi:hypothetical protein
VLDDLSKYFAATGIRENTGKSFFSAYIPVPSRYSTGSPKPSQAGTVHTRKISRIFVCEEFTVASFNQSDVRDLKFGKSLSLACPPSLWAGLSPPAFVRPAMPARLRPPGHAVRTGRSGADLSRPPIFMAVWRDFDLL